MRLEDHGQYGKIILPGKVDLTNANKFKRALQSLYEKGYNSITVDCAELAMIDSAGLGSLVMLQKRLKERGGELKMINVGHKYIRHLFDMLELERIIKIERS